MTAFVAAAAALALLAALAVLFGPRLQRRGGAIPQALTNAAVLRQQLAELEVEAARGQLAAEDFARARDDLQRRLLAEAGAGVVALGAPSPAPRRALLVYALLLPLAAAVLYRHFGHPQLLAAPASPLSADASATPEVEPLLLRLQAHVTAAPNDARAWVMLARLRMQRDEFEAAAVAYQRALEASPNKVGRDPFVWCELADAIGMAQGGRLAGRPRELIDKALSLDAAHPRALEMAGSAAYEANDFLGAARYWKQLLALIPETSAEYAQLSAAIDRAEQRRRFRRPVS
jgi:cytochrome c-type biogenesis protein CcmH